MITETRMAPHSKEDEMMVLGSMITNISNLGIAAESLDEGDFYFKEHKIIFKVLKQSHKKNKPADVHIICQELKRQETLQEVGGISYVVSLAQYAGVSAYIEEYIERVKSKSLLRSLISINQIAEREALDNPDNPQQIIDKLQTNIKSIESRHGKKIPIIDSTERIDREKAFLNTFRGKKHIGLLTTSIKEFNENFLGLRGLILLAAAPNVGKTALTVQIAVDVLSTEKDACLVYLSLEMSEEQIFRRMILNLSGFNFRSYVFGTESQQIMDNDGDTAFFKADELKKIKEAESKLKDFGSRLQIIDQSTCPYIDARTIVNYVEAVKAKSNCSRAIVIIDYLQVWPIRESHKGFPSENEADKWRIGEMKKIRDAMNNDPIIVISEARKPSGKDDTWAGDLSDVMGSARGTYTPDVVMLLSPLKLKALSAIWQSNKMPNVPLDENVDGSDVDKNGSAIKNALEKIGIAICKLDAPKVRDGMQKFSILLEHHFHKNTFRKIKWDEIRTTLKSEIGANTKNLFGNK